jgi:PhnB protein
MAFHAYLFFGGDCAAAFTRYQQVFGGDLTVMRMGDAPGAEDVPPEQAELTIHAALMFEDGALLMGSDDPTTDSFGPVQGMMVSYTAVDEADCSRVFEALAEGGQVSQPLIETFFSPSFGMCTDRFGTPWMISVDQVPEPA